VPAIVAGRPALVAVLKLDHRLQYRIGIANVLNGSGFRKFDAADGGAKPAVTAGVWFEGSSRAPLARLVALAALKGLGGAAATRLGAAEPLSRRSRAEIFQNHKTLKYYVFLRRIGLVSAAR
jgi:hypothetical protein